MDEAEAEGKGPPRGHVERGSTSDRQVRVEGLVVGSAYKVRVAACNAVGRGPWSPWTPDIHVTEERVGDLLDN